MRIAVLVGSLLVASPAIAGPCKFHRDLGLVPELLTPAGATLDPHGGVVVAAVSARLAGATLQDPTTQDWLFGDGQQHATVARTVIAPGLVVHAPTLASADLTLEDQGQHPMLTVHWQAGAPSRVAAAPRVTAVTAASHLGIMHRALTTATLATRPPADAVALVVFAGKTARSWAPVSELQGLDLAIYAVDDCVVQIPGTIATRAGDRITLAWLDDTGHLSARSAPIVVRRRGPAPRP